MEKRSEPDTLDQTGDHHVQAAPIRAAPARRHAGPNSCAATSSDVRWAQVASQARVGRADQAGEAARSWFPPCSAPYAGIPGPARVRCWTSSRRLDGTVCMLHFREKGSAANETALKRREGGSCEA